MSNTGPYGAGNLKTLLLLQFSSPISQTFWEHWPHAGYIAGYMYYFSRLLTFLSLSSGSCFFCCRFFSVSDFRETPWMHQRVMNVLSFFLWTFFFCFFFLLCFSCFSFPWVPINSWWDILTLTFTAMSLAWIPDQDGQTAIKILDILLTITRVKTYNCLQKYELIMLIFSSAWPCQQSLC